MVCVHCTGCGSPYHIAHISSKSFSAQDASAQINFPLSVNGGIFFGGNADTFRMTVSPTDSSQIKTFTEITLAANAAPTSGKILVSPANGTALVTQFLMSSPGWAADASSYPLSYAFSYRLSTAAAYLTIAASSLRAFTTTMLPAGPLSEGNMLTLKTQITDIYLSFSTTTTTARVTLSAATNLSNILTASLTSAFATGDVNFAIQTVNNVS